MRPRLLLTGLMSALAAGLLLAACDEAEQGRILKYEKGTYLGEKDQELSDSDKEVLRQRTRLQQGS